MNTAMLMSGGVDSSVSAQLLYNQGVDFDPYYIKISMEGFDDDYSCTQEEDVEMASAVCRKFGKKLEIIDLHREYWDNVVTYHLDRVKKGLTPNPDVMCNRLIKFGAFDEKTNFEYDKIVTGHYANTLADEDGHTWLMTAPDPVKDQTDFLANMTPTQVAKAWFPIGAYMKNEVRYLADKYNLAPKNRKDSQGICFLGKINYNEFIEKHLGINPGEIIEFETGNVIGKHRGYWYHTIGQRKGLGLSGGPWFVVKKDVNNNIVYVSKNQELLNRKVNSFKIGKLSDINWCTIPILNEDNNSMRIYMKIRHSPEFTPATMFIDRNDDVVIVFENFIGGIAPGQFCTLYDDNKEICFGCGEIQI